MHPYESLREKLVQPFLLLGFIVSAALSLITFGLLAQIEERAIERALHAELESFRYRVSLNAQATPASGTLLRGNTCPTRRYRAYAPSPPARRHRHSQRWRRRMQRSALRHRRPAVRPHL